MLENLFNLVKENAGDAIVNNPAIPDQLNDAAISETAQGIFDSLKGQLIAGNADSITGLFKEGAQASNPMVGQISKQVSQTLSEKFGIDASSAGKIVSGLIPTVMNQLVHKTNDPNDSSFEINDMISSLGKGGNVMDKVKGLFSL